MQPKSSAALFTALVLTCALVGPAQAGTEPAEKVPASPGGQMKAHAAELARRVDTTALLKRAARAVSQSDAGKKMAAFLGVETFLSFNVFNVNYAPGAIAVNQSVAGKERAASLCAETFLSYDVFNINGNSDLIIGSSGPSKFVCF